MHFNGKGVFKIWASKKGEILDGKPFHLYPKSMGHFCKTLRKSGWKINQIKKVVMPEAI